MRTCHACKRELEERSLAAGRCAHCGAVVIKISKRTIEDRRFLSESDSNNPTISDVGKKSADKGSLDIEITDTDSPGATIEMSFSDLGRGKDEADDSPPAGAQTIDVVPKSPTVDERIDATLEFQPPPDANEPANGGKSKGRSTHTIEQDLTLEFNISPADAQKLSSQWSGTFDPNAKQGQTIRQKETVTGFRSSLPVKSRYVREKRKAGSAPPKSAAEVPDYELLDIIGEGGMGVVYAAHQSSIARTVAVKMLKPSAKIREEQRDKFISEAVVTGELDHPNIVPIYDLGSNEDGALFYSMKRVKGTPWDKVINHKQLDENLSILLRVADAVAFAHAGGVIHRDLKPENVMLGDYGEVLVMDWGLARITPEFAHVASVYQADSLGGTPAYMAPEMARGPIERINKTSDIYLLGAILYEIIGGQPPHSGRDVMQCLLASSQNRIDAIRYDGELKEIALKAMATQQEDRYQSVKEFQEAVRVYQSHSESLVLTAHANQNLQKARASGDYALYARALYGCQEALALWNDNHRARSLLADTQRDYATAALANGDLDLASSLLDTSNPEHESLLKQIAAARAERDARQRRLRLAKMAVAALVAGIIVTSTVAYFVVRQERNIAIAAEKEAVEAKEKEEEARGVAEEERDAAERARNAAEEAKKQEEDARKKEEEARVVAENAKIEEERAKKAEEYEGYIAEIGLANAKINDNAFDFAKQLLAQSNPGLRNWEWGRLAYLADLDAATYDAAGPVHAVAYSPPDGKWIASGDMAGRVTVRDAQTGAVRWEARHEPFALAVAFSHDGSKLASGGSDRKIQIYDAASGNVLSTLEGHTDGILSVRFSPDGTQLLSGSYDNTARLWDLTTSQTLQELKRHSWWVWAAEFSPDAQKIVTAGQDGKAVVWQKQGTGSREQGATTDGSPLPLGEVARNRAGEGSALRNANPSPLDNLLPLPKGEATDVVQLYEYATEFSGHNGAVYTARFSPKGDLVATGGADNLVMVWNPDDAQPVDIEKRLDGAPEPKANHLQLAGHDKPVRSVAFSPHGELLLSGSDDNAVRVWDLASGRSLKVLRGHGNAVRSSEFSPDGNYVVSGGEDQKIRVWDVRGYEETRLLHATLFSGHADAVLSARFSHDGRQIITASRDRTASLWDAATGKQLKQFVEGHEFLVSGAAFFVNEAADGGARLATGAVDNSVRIWDVAAGTQLLALSPTGRVGTLAVSPDGKWIATGGPNKEVRVWNTNTGQLLPPLSGHITEVWALAFSPTGDRLATGDDRGNVRIWRKATEAEWTLQHELEGHNGTITAIRFTPDGQRLVTASGDRTCGQWDLSTGQELRNVVLKHPEWVSSLDLSADGTQALTTCDDGFARFWRLADATVLASVKAPGKPFKSNDISPDGSTALLTSSENKQVSLWDLSAAAAGFRVQGSDSDALNPELQTLNPHLRPFLNFNQLGGEVWSAMFSPDGRHVLTIGGNDARLWNLDSRTPVVRYSPHGAVASAALSPDGRLVATGSWDKSAKIWDAQSGRAIRKLEGGHTEYVNAVEFSPDGSELLTASDDGTARLWNVESGKPTDTVFRGHTARVTAATFSSDGSRVLTVSGDKTARVWDRGAGNLVKKLEGHDWAVLCGQFSPDGQRVITGSQDNTARIWDLNASDAESAKPITLGGHTAAITAVAFSPDGSRVLTGSQDNTAKLWDAHTGKEILSLPGHTQEVTSVAFSPDGLNVLTSSRDGTAIIWQAKEWREKNVAILESQRAD
jgi:WD40 repeat protein/serine/threonine protein kinase